MNESAFIVNANEQNFAAVVLEASNKLPVMVDFWAAWCGPCQILMPQLANLANEYQGKFILAKVNTDEQNQLAAQWGIRSLPTVKIFRFGKVVDEFMGVQQNSVIRAMIERHIERESDKILAEAEHIYQQGDTETSIKLLSDALQQDPANKRIPIVLSEMLLGQGEYDRAEELIKSLSLDLQTEPDVISLMAHLEFARITQNSSSIETLIQQINDDPKNSMAHYQLSAHYVLKDDYEAALQLLMEILRTDRKFGDDAARKAILKIFDLLGGQGELVSRYRSMMFNILH